MYQGTMWNLRVLKVLWFLELCSRPDGHNSTTIERISFLLEQFCPDDRICMSNRTDRFPSDFKRHSCCSVCSCEDSCHFSNNCCFPEWSKTNNTQTVMKLHRAHKTCLYPFLAKTNNAENKRMNYDSYNMISSVGVAAVHEACGDKNVSSWGSLQPVYSKQKDLIFKNPICARAYGVDDGVLWTPFLVCNTYSTHFNNDGATFSLSPGINYIPDDCYVFFQYPGHDIDSHVCYTHEEFIDTCKYSEFSLPAHVEQYKDEITSACTSGLISPYKLFGMYANVFCYICNGNSFNDNFICTAGNVRSGESGIGFFGLLNIEFLQLHERRTKKRKFPMACRRSNVQEALCREIYCSSGKSRDFDGNCHFSTKRWYNSEYSVLVNLTSADDIDIEHVFVPGKELDTLKRTWPKDSFVDVIAHLMTKNNTLSNNILVLIKLRLDDINPNKLIDIIDKMIHRQWGVFIGGVEVSLHADFSKIQGCVSLYPFDEISFMNEVTFRGTEDNSSSTQALPAIKRIYKDLIYLVIRWPPFHITKLYFCEQVELYDSEFIIGEDIDVHVLYNKITGQYMYDGEFTLLHKNGAVIPRVCLESSGLMRSLGNSHTRSYNGVCLVLVFTSSIATWLFIIVQACL